MKKTNVYARKNSFISKILVAVKLLKEKFIQESMAILAVTAAKATLIEMVKL